VNHPASVNTSDQPSSSSANFSLFISAVPLRSSDISSVPGLNLKPNPHGGTAKKIEASQKEKIKQATTKTNHLASNVLPGPSKRWNRRVCQDPTPSDTTSDSDTGLAVPFADDLM
jgi:hypothetical protein